ncbi:MAG: ribosome silencing factor [Bacteroidetes bacterium GWF2_33_16]|nr:MAG: ribosome silencing factor [Bacteroidetes bacterium GWE2_32_14]OFY05172.1 MAG: ribosome silencing factor [Bacteroidetes bacterium GWF2_33_16]
MGKRKVKVETGTEALLASIVEGIHRKKGKEVVSLDLTKIENAVCKYFVVCHGESNTQVDALADSVMDTVLETIGEKVWHKEGKSTATWILLDYADVVVHIFQKSYRDFYKIEDLWADAKLTKYEDVVKSKGETK